MAKESELDAQRESKRELQGASRGGWGIRRKTKKAPAVRSLLGLGKPGDTYFLARSNIIGGVCLTTVFGMGTGMARILWSPGMLVEQAMNLDST